MNRSTSAADLSSRWAILVLSVAALALAGCGRKGGLDLPPQSSMQPTATSAPATSANADSAESKGTSLFAPAGALEGSPSAAKGRKRPFLLDPILD